jgi:alkylation response protein AidB-like acyl-CoA dehydrogenase
MKDLLYSATEEELRSAVRGMFADRVSTTKILARAEADLSTVEDSALWRTLATEMGCAGLTIPEEYGGAGASWREVAVVAEEVGRALAPVPFLGSAVMATAALLACDDRELLTALASGERTAALVVPFGTSPHRPTTPGGTVTGVVDALHADVLLVQTDDGLYAVDAASDVSRTPIVSLDLTRPLADVTVDTVVSDVTASGRRIGPGDTVTAALTAGAAILASEQLGVAEWCLTTTVEYVKQRHQFGRPVGSYQALKHRLADLWVDVTQARAAVRYAAGCLADGDPDLPVAVALAQAHCSAVAVRAAEECVQMHGGIGFTWEHPAHLYLKRAKADQIALGTPDRHRAALAELVDLPLG